MRLRFGKPGLAAICLTLAVPAIAWAAHARGGTFTSTAADIHVAKGGAKIVNADSNCRFQSGVGSTEAIDFNTPIAINRSGPSHTAAPRNISTSLAAAIRDG